MNPPESGAPIRAAYHAAIGGQEVTGEEHLALLDPRTGAPFSTVIRGGAREIDLAVEAAAAAFEVWRAIPALERGRLLIDIARRLRAEVEPIAALECHNTGRRLVECRGDVETAAQFFEFYGGLAPGIEGTVIEPSAAARFTYQVVEPFGVTGHIIPWNAPLMLAARGIAPALAAGNVVVAKPAEQTPITCLELERIGREVGLPAGVINVVPGLGVEAGAALAAHPRVPRITFTGSVEAARHVQQLASPRMCQLTLELGGKSANIVFPDADLDLATESLVSAITYGTGQVCSAASRLLVAAEVHDEVVERVRQSFHRIEEAAEDAGGMAPLISAEQQSRVLGYVRTGVREGATLVTGDAENDRPGFYVRPALFTGVNPEMSIFSEEIFGPVLAVSRFEDEDEAVRLANATDYGLAAGLWTESVRRVLRIVPKLDVGMVYVNGYLNGGVESPVAGRRLSGIGHEKGRLALETYLRIKTVALSY